MISEASNCCVYLLRCCQQLQMQGPIGDDLDRSRHDLLEVLLRYLSQATEENDERP
jgi:hypothetical protein